MFFAQTYQKFFENMSEKVDSLFSVRMVKHYFNIFFITLACIIYNFEVIKIIVFQIFIVVIILVNVITLLLICVYGYYNKLLPDDVKNSNHILEDYIEYFCPWLMPSNKNNEYLYKKILEKIFRNRNDNNENTYVDSDTETENYITGGGFNVLNTEEINNESSNSESDIDSFVLVSNAEEINNESSNSESDIESFVLVSNADINESDSFVLVDNDFIDEYSNTPTN